jgi:hypothetical protein
MIGPVFGEDKTQPNGIIQFINKVAQPEEKEAPEIGPADFAKFKELQSLMGMCIDNTHEIAGTVEIALQVNNVMKKIKQTMKVEQDNAEAMPGDTLFEDMQKTVSEIKEQYN